MKSQWRDEVTAQLRHTEKCPYCSERVLEVEHIFDIEPDGSPSNETEYCYLECFQGCKRRWPSWHEFDEEYKIRRSKRQEEITV